MRKLFFTLILFNSLYIVAQNMKQVKSDIDTLCSNNYYGRGYVNNGHIKAANYIAKRFKQIGLKKYSKIEFKQPTFFQKFPINVNTFPNELYLKADKKELDLGNSYIMAPFSSGGKGKGKVVKLDTNIFNDEILASEFMKQTLKRKVFVYNENDHDKLISLGPEYLHKAYSAKAIIKLKNKKLTASLANSQYSNPLFEVLKDSFPSDIKKIKYKVDAEVKEIHSQNVIGYIEGSEQPDSFFIYCAHYDHLGGMGDVYFPGANDNAAGIAMLFELADYYSKPENKPKHSIMFIAFGGEEAGLLGSKYYTANPLYPLEFIKFVFNLDLVATGSKGATIVNGKVFKKQFDKLDSLNQKGKYLPNIKKRGEAANSDHYFFSEEGIPSFFIYLMGGPSAYHDVNDVPENLPLTKFKELYNLLIEFEKTF